MASPEWLQPGHPVPESAIAIHRLMIANAMLCRAKHDDTDDGDDPYALHGGYRTYG